MKKSHRRTFNSIPPKRRISADKPRGL